MSCDICLGPWEAPMLSVVCGHGACAECLMQWIRGCALKAIQARCPSCRASLTTFAPNRMVSWPNPITSAQRAAIDFLLTMPPTPSLQNLANQLVFNASMVEELAAGTDDFTQTLFRSHAQGAIKAAETLIARVRSIRQDPTPAFDTAYAMLLAEMRG